MTLRELRRRWTPAWLTTDARRRRRNVLLRRFGIQRCYTPPILSRRPDLQVRSWLPFVVAHELLHNPTLSFLQIGAYDGIGDDDLRELITTHGLRGVLVEPQPAAFHRLEHTYRDQPQVVLLPAAIAESEGTRALYCRRGRATMAASFDRSHLLRHGIPDEDIVIHQVTCHTIESALHAAGFDQVDLIQIDAEGFDWPIIRSIDFTRLQPAIIRFEYRNMPGRDADACLEFLSNYGYRFLLEPRDIIAYRAAVADGTVSADSRARLSA